MCPLPNSQLRTHNVKMERETGFEPATPSLEGLRSSQLSYSRISNSEYGVGNADSNIFSLLTPHFILGTPNYFIWWGGEVSNLRRLTPTDLQSVPFGHSGTSPGTASLCRLILSRNHDHLARKLKSSWKLKKWSHRRDSNPRQADYKSATLPTELRWRKPLDTPRPFVS
jgi:hypothetical protein